MKFKRIIKSTLTLSLVFGVTLPIISSNAHANTILNNNPLHQFTKKNTNVPSQTASLASQILLEGLDSTEYGGSYVEGEHFVIYEVQNKNEKQSLKSHQSIQNIIRKNNLENTVIVKQSPLSLETLNQQRQLIEHYMKTTPRNENGISYVGVSSLAFNNAQDKVSIGFDQNTKSFQEKVLRISGIIPEALAFGEFTSPSLDNPEKEQLSSDILPTVTFSMGSRIYVNGAYGTMGLPVYGSNNTKFFSAGHGRYGNGQVMYTDSSNTTPIGVVTDTVFDDYLDVIVLDMTGYGNTISNLLPNNNILDNPGSAISPIPNVGVNVNSFGGTTGTTTAIVTDNSATLSPGPGYLFHDLVLTTGSESLSGDSGSGLTFYDNIRKQTTGVGILSFGDSSYTAYTKVKNYYNHP